MGSETYADEEGGGFVSESWVIDLSFFFFFYYSRYYDTTSTTISYHSFLVQHPPFIKTILRSFVLRSNDLSHCITLLFPGYLFLFSHSIAMAFFPPVSRSLFSGGVYHQFFSLGFGNRERGEGYIGKRFPFVLR